MSTRSTSWLLVGFFLMLSGLTGGSWAYVTDPDPSKSLNVHLHAEAT